MPSLRNTKEWPRDLCKAVYRGLRRQLGLGGTYHEDVAPEREEVHHDRLRPNPSSAPDSAHYLEPKQILEEETTK